MLLNKSKNPFGLVNERNLVKPGYELTDKEFYFDIFISHTQEICLVCKIDNNYISDLSFSTVSDLERTQVIIDSMIDSFGTTVSTEYSILGREKYYEVKNWYKLQIKKASDFKEGEYYRTLPYELAEYNFMQSYMAKVIKSTFNKLSEKCTHRIANGLYIPILESYYELLSRYKRNDKEAHGYYYKMKNLISIIDEECYLKLSHDNKVRELYLSLKDCASALYGAYMDVR